MYDAPCPECKELVEFDPYQITETLPGLYDPFPCRHCGTVIEVYCDELEDEDGGYEWSYWLVKTTQSGGNVP